MQRHSLTYRHYELQEELEAYATERDAERMTRSARAAAGRRGRGPSGAISDDSAIARRLAEQQRAQSVCLPVDEAGCIPSKPGTETAGI